MDDRVDPLACGDELIVLGDVEQREALVRRERNVSFPLGSGRVLRLSGREREGRHRKTQGDTERHRETQRVSERGERRERERELRL